MIYIVLTYIHNYRQNKKCNCIFFNLGVNILILLKRNWLIILVDQ